MVHVATAAQAAHELRSHTLVPQHALVARGRDQPLHADGAVLGSGEHRGEAEDWGGQDTPRSALPLSRGQTLTPPPRAAGRPLSGLHLSKGGDTPRY